MQTATARTRANVAAEYQNKVESIRQKSQDDVKASGASDELNSRLTRIDVAEQAAKDDSHGALGFETITDEELQKFNNQRAAARQHYRDTVNSLTSGDQKKIDAAKAESDRADAQAALFLFDRSDRSCSVALLFCVGRLRIPSRFFETEAVPVAGN